MFQLLKQGNTYNLGNFFLMEKLPLKYDIFANKIRAWHFRSIFPRLWKAFFIKRVWYCPLGRHSWSNWFKTIQWWSQFVQKGLTKDLKSLLHWWKLVVSKMVSKRGTQDESVKKSSKIPKNSQIPFRIGHCCNPYFWSLVITRVPFIHHSVTHVNAC